MSNTVTDVVTFVSVPRELDVQVVQPAVAAVGARLGMGEDIVKS